MAALSFKLIFPLGLNREYNQGMTDETLFKIVAAGAVAIAVLAIWLTVRIFKRGKTGVICFAMALIWFGIMGAFIAYVWVAMHNYRPITPLVIHH